MSFDGNDALQYYKRTNRIIEKIVSNLNWLNLCNELYLLDNPIMPESQLNTEECKVYYAKEKTENGIQNSMENAAWTTSVLLMSWVLYNLKYKTDNGHCWNTKHGHETQEPKCHIGSDFHNKLWIKCLDSFKDLINNIENEPPNPIVKKE